MISLLKGAFFAGIAVVGVVWTAAAADKCDIGYYVDSNGNCVKCAGNWGFNYCPDGINLVPCPEIKDDYEKLTGGVLLRNEPHTYRDGGLIDSANYCLSYPYIRVTEGEYLLECLYMNGNYWDYCKGRNLWYKAGNGYYLSRYSHSSWEDWYWAVKACTNAPRNAHYTGPGTPDEPKSGGTKDYNDCPWECDAGKLCQTPCSAGFQYLQVSTGVKVKLWNEKLTDRSLVVEYNGRKCYGNLDAGAASGALNVNIGGTTYHLAD